MPLHSFVNANREAAEKKRADPFVFDLTEKYYGFTARWHIDFVVFVREIMFRPETDWSDGAERSSGDVRPTVDTIRDCLIDADQARWDEALALSSHTEDPADYISPATIGAIHDALFEYYRGARPLEDSDSSADGQSSDGTNSTDSSSTEPSAKDAGLVMD